MTHLLSEVHVLQDIGGLPPRVGVPIEIDSGWELRDIIEGALRTADARTPVPVPRRPTRAGLPRRAAPGRRLGGGEASLCGMTSLPPPPQAFRPTPAAPVTFTAAKVSHSTGYLVGSAAAGLALVGVGWRRRRLTV